MQNTSLCQSQAQWLPLSGKGNDKKYLNPPLTTVHSGYAAFVLLMVATMVQIESPVIVTADKYFYWHKLFFSKQHYNVDPLNHCAEWLCIIGVIDGGKLLL